MMYKLCSRQWTIPDLMRDMNDWRGGSLPDETLVGQAHFAEVDSDF
jgi:hypothetical protein